MQDKPPVLPLDYFDEKPPVLPLDYFDKPKVKPKAKPPGFAIGVAAGMVPAPKARFEDTDLGKAFYRQAERAKPKPQPKVTDLRGVAQKVVKGEEVVPQSEATRTSNFVRKKYKLTPEESRLLDKASETDSYVEVAKALRRMKSVPQDVKDRVWAKAEASPEGAQRRFMESGAAISVDDPKRLGSTITEIAGDAAKRMGLPPIIGEALSYPAAAPFYGMQAGIKAQEGDFAGAGLDVLQSAFGDIPWKAVGPAVKQFLGKMQSGGWKGVMTPAEKKAAQLIEKGAYQDAEKVLEAIPIEEAIPGFTPKKLPLEAPPTKTGTAPGANIEPSGLSRASRAVHADVYGTRKPTSIGGKSLDELYENGKAKVDEGYDFEGEMAELAKAGRPASDEQIGIFAAGRDALLADLKRLNSRLDSGDATALAERETLLDKIADFDRNLDEVKGAAGRSLKALQIGQTVNWSDLDEVLIEARRVKPALTGADERAIKKLVDQTPSEARIAELEKQVAELKAGGAQTRAAGRKLTKEAIAKEREEIFTEIDTILKEASSTGVHDIGSAAYTTVVAGSKLAIAGGKLAINLAKEGVATLDEIVEKVVTEFRSRGLEIDRQTLIDEMSAPQTAGRTKSELEKHIASLRAQAKRESTAAKAAKDEKEQIAYAERVYQYEQDIAEAKRQLERGYYRVPQKRELQLSRELEGLRDTKMLYEAKTRAAVKRLMGPQQLAITKAAKGVSGFGKIMTLGADFGAVLRQGLFGITNPRAFGRALANAKQAMKSEEGLVKLEMASMEKRLPDGRLAEKIRRKSGLSRSSVIGGDVEEGYLIGILDKLIGGTIGRIPGLKGAGGSLGRGQAALLNTLRNEMFDDFLVRHAKDVTEKELEDWAAYLNSALGRSSTFGAKRQPTDLAQIVLTSPRYEASRWEMVGNYLASPATAAKAFTDKAARAKIINMAGTAASVLGTLKILEATGVGELNLDPESSDFLKLRAGDKVIDLTAGISPRLRGALRAYYFFADPEAKTQYTKATGEPYKRNETVAKEILSATTRPIAPLYTGLAEERTGYSLSGWREDEGDPKGWERLMPLIMQGFKQDYEAGGLGDAAQNAAIEFFGGSVQRYPAKPKK